MAPDLFFHLTKTHNILNLQAIEHDGQPVYVSVPYAQYRRLVKMQDLTIPHEVIKAVVMENKSLPQAWREYLGLTQSEVAQRLNITQGALSQIEANCGLRRAQPSGEHPRAGGKKPRLSTLKKLADALGLHLEQLQS